MKETVVRARVSEQEKLCYEKEAEKAGISMADWVRGRLNGDDKPAANDEAANAIEVKLNPEETDAMIDASVKTGLVLHAWVKRCLLAAAIVESNQGAMMILTEEEHAKVQAAADKADLSASQWLRWSIQHGIDFQAGLTGVAPATTALEGEERSDPTDAPSAESAPSVEGANARTEPDMEDERRSDSTGTTAQPAQSAGPLSTKEVASAPAGTTPKPPKNKKPRCPSCKRMWPDPLTNTRRDCVQCAALKEKK